jgi:hypothetical protein
MTCKSKALAIGLLALGSLYPSVAPAEEIACPPAIAGGVVTEKVIVPAGLACEITGSEIKGSIELGKDADLLIRGGKLSGNVECPDGGAVTLLEEVLVTGNIQGCKDGENEGRDFRARLIGGEEIPPISTSATGRFRASVNPLETMLTYELQYSALEGGNATAAHVHFAQKGVAGAVMFFLCGGGSKPACPSTGGTVTGTVVASDILAIPAQGLAAGDFAAALQAMRDGLSYANVHSVTFTGGEIRGQIKAK